MQRAMIKPWAAKLFGLANLLAVALAGGSVEVNERGDLSMLVSTFFISFGARPCH